jgi:hypothetical protein
LAYRLAFSIFPIRLEFNAASPGAKRRRAIHQGHRRAALGAL